MSRWMMGVAVCVLVCGGPAHADLSVRLDSAQITEDGQGVLNVYIKSDAANRLTSFNYSFSITALGGVGSQLVFADPQPTAYVFGPSSNYVFDQPFGLDGTVVSPYSTYSDSDTTISDDGFETIGATERLLARLTLDAGFGTLNPQAGDQFQVSINLDPDQTAFFDENLDVTPFTLATDSSGLVTIVSSVVVPEPSSALIALISLTSCCVLLAIRSRMTPSDRIRLVP